jgi:primosomal protein N' (replication factor Y)
VAHYYYRLSLLRSAAPELTYHSDAELRSGQIVRVRLKSTLKQAVILTRVDPPDFETSAIEAIEARVFSDEQMEIARFISAYYFSSFSEAISLFLPFGQKSIARLALRVEECRGAPRGYPRDEKESIEEMPRPALSAEQQRAYEALLDKDKALLFGVTGSGKTEVFVALMAHTLSAGQTAIFLMPEISLTPQMEKRLRVYFGDAVAMWHSKISKKKKEQILAGIEEGTVRIVAGARSALFTPLPDLGLVIVDEEHDDSYKAMTRPRYHARDVAVLVAQKHRARVVLASATPAASTFHKYHTVRIDQPYIQTQKRYRFVSGEGITPAIIDAIERHYKAGGQSLIFLPTRGNFKYLYCPQCGAVHRCPYCSVGMALHRRSRHLRCHYCNYTEPIREACTACGYAPLSSERMGTVEAIEMITEAIPGITIEQFDKDAITTPNKLARALERFGSGESRVLLGTQMLSKGHDYADITLSVITGVDYIAGMADYRARERAVSLAVQIAGRSGRAREAEVIIQTADPESYRPYLEHYEALLEDELAFLEHALYPPFSSLARILIAHKEESRAAQITQQCVEQLKRFDQIEIIGHGKAPIERIANRYRYTILLRSQKRKPLLQALHAINRREIEIDMDPVEFS